ncbi:MAG: alpha/beta hydrolase-fold protein [Panacibacter sp.]
MRKKVTTLLLLQCICFISFAQQFKVSYSANAYNKPFSGKVILFLNREVKSPKDAPVDMTSFPCFSIDVKNVQPGSSIVFDDKAISYPVKLSDIERGEYYVQAVWDRNLGGRSISESPGNIYNAAIKVSVSKDISKTFTINCDKVITERGFNDTKFVKALQVPSALLSSFHNKPVTVDAAVILPEEYYTQPERKFPVLFIVSGFGGDYHYYSGDTNSRSRRLDTIATITVYLDGNCSLGHSVYANSDNNGPWGDALVNELIPAFESKYRSNGARFLQGHSSGGWSVLYLQTHYTKTFAGCWSSSPDPVDFRNFQTINLYEYGNLFYNKDSVMYSAATIAGRFPWISMKQAVQEEYVIYRGEQMHSFDAVFGAKAADGHPELICDPVTGSINKKAFEHWKPYDISAYLRNNWTTLKNDLEGKIRVTVGEQDNFLLNYPVHMLEADTKKLNANFAFEYFPGDHFTVSTPEYRTKGMKFLAEKYLQWQLKNKQQ